ncbi:unnamed protein product [Sphagnum jensenii]
MPKCRRVCRCALLHHAAYLMCFQLSRKFMVLPGGGIFHGIVHKMIEVQPPLPGNNNNVADRRKQSLAGFQLIGTSANPGVKQAAGVPVP